MVLLLLLLLLCGGSLQEQQRYDLHMQESVMVQEGLCVHVPCSFDLWNSSSSSSKVYIYWYHTGYSKLVATNNPNKPVKLKLQSRFFLGDSRNNNCSLSIRDVRKSDTGTYIFQMETANTVKYNYQDKQLTLRVTELTEKPDILISHALESGCPTQLTCSLPGSCEGGRPLAFSWVGPAVDSLNPQNLCSSVLTFTPRPQDHGTNLTCQVKRQGSRVTTERTIWLNVFYAPQNLTIGMSFRNVTGSPPSCRCASEEQQGCWYLVLILIRGALMGAGFLLTYGLTWLYYTRCGGPQAARPTS